MLRQRHQQRRQVHCQNRHHGQLCKHLLEEHMHRGVSYRVVWRHPSLQMENWQASLGVRIWELQMGADKRAWERLITLAHFPRPLEKLVTIIWKLTVNALTLSQELGLARPLQCLNLFSLSLKIIFALNWIKILLLLLCCSCCCYCIYLGMGECLTYHDTYMEATRQLTGISSLFPSCESQE